MIVSVNPKPQKNEFEKLMATTNALLNKEALSRSDYFSKRNGNLLEEDVRDALEVSSKGTQFEGSIELISGNRFPDIIAAKYYGVEVKSTKGDQWTSVGNSILESTRVSDIDRIYMTFGKLGGHPVEFISRPYEECLYDIAVTHMPRYLINMQLSEGESIFDKMNITYDSLRQSGDPIAYVSRYYRSIMKEGESLWWTGESVDEAVSPKMRVWKSVAEDEKRKHIAYALVNYPEVVGGNYDRFSLWLVSQGIANPHIRDQFSAGGKEPMIIDDKGTVELFPAVYRRIKDNFDSIMALLSVQEPKKSTIIVPAKYEALKERFLIWCKMVSDESNVNNELSNKALTMLYSKYIKQNA